MVEYTDRILIMILNDMMYVTRLEITKKVAEQHVMSTRNLRQNICPHKSIVVDNLLECITIEIMISGHKNVIVSCLYRTPGSNINYFSEILCDLYSELSVYQTIFMWIF